MGVEKVAGVVFSDLDATLLDHHTYDFTPARPALDALADQSIPLVLCSSKTRAELLEWQDTLGVEGPFVAENGGGVFLRGMARWARRFPETIGGLPAKRFGAEYAALRRALGHFARHAPGRIGGFGDMGPERIAQLTGLDTEQAALAARRDFDEPFLWEPQPDATAVELAQAFFGSRGLRLTRGGRFWHLMGRSDKGRAVRWLLDDVFSEGGGRPSSLALGDSRNDLEMLQVVHRGVLVARHDGSHADGMPAEIHMEPGIGPAGWNSAVLAWLETIA